MKITTYFQIVKT